MTTTNCSHCGEATTPNRTRLGRVLCSECFATKTAHELDES